MPLDGVLNQLVPIVESKLFFDVLPMRLNCFDAHMQGFGDLPRPLPLAD